MSERKTPARKLESFGVLRDINEDARQVTAVISTGDVARDDAIIDPAGWDFSNYNRNPVVLWSHDDMAMPMARTIETLATDSELIAKAEFDAEDPDAERLFSKIQRGFVNTTSVRWLPHESEMREVGEGDDAHQVLVFTRQELLEWSFVSIPADPKALILRADTGEALDPNDFIHKRAYEGRGNDLYAIPADLADEIDYLHTLLEAMQPGDLAARLDGDGLTQAEALRGHLNRVLGVGKEEAATAPPSRLMERVAEYLERRDRQPSVVDVVAKALAAATGKPEERIRQAMAERGS